MTIFNISGRFYRVVNNNLTMSRLFALSKVFSRKNNKILILGLVPVIPNISAQDINNTEAITSHRPSPTDVSKDETKSDRQYFENEKTPWERVKAIYEIDEFGNYSKELVTTLHCCCMAMFVGTIYGGVQRSRIAFHDFMERNQATIFENHLDAKRRLQSHVTIHFGKGAVYWAWRLSAFTGGYMLTFLSLHAYRGTTRLIDYAVSGAVVGAIMRLKFGPPAMVVGGAVGGILGFLSGISNETLFTLFGTSYDEVLSTQYKLDRERSMLMEEITAQRFEKSGVIPEPLFERLKEKEKNIGDI